MENSQKINQNEGVEGWGWEKRGAGIFLATTISCRNIFIIYTETHPGVIIDHTQCRKHLIQHLVSEQCTCPSTRQWYLWGKKNHPVCSNRRTLGLRRRIITENKAHYSLDYTLVHDRKCISHTHTLNTHTNTYLSVLTYPGLIKKNKQNKRSFLFIWEMSENRTNQIWTW